LKGFELAFAPTPDMLNCPVQSPHQ